MVVGNIGDLEDFRNIPSQVEDCVKVADRVYNNNAQELADIASRDTQTIIIKLEALEAVNELL